MVLQYKRPTIASIMDNTAACDYIDKRESQSEGITHNNPPVNFKPVMVYISEDNGHSIIQFRNP
jgi:hypothetical protein